jgi:Mrp family chromosome partitioning ATPase
MNVTTPTSQGPMSPTLQSAGDSRHHDPAVDAVATIPSRRSFPRECVDLYHAVEAFRVHGRTGAIIVQFVGPCGGEGTTTIASGFALAAGEFGPAVGAPTDGDRYPAVLCVDCGGEQLSGRHRAGPPSISLVDAFVAGLLFPNAITPATETAGVCFARLGLVRTDGSLRCDTADLARLFGVLRQRFQVVALDCSGASETEVLACARHCDGSLIVIRAERTASRAVEALRARIERCGGQVIGAVLNRSHPRRGWFGRLGRA